MSSNAGRLRSGTLGHLRTQDPMSRAWHLQLQVFAEQRPTRSSTSKRGSNRTRTCRCGEILSLRSTFESLLMQGIDSGTATTGSAALPRPATFEEWGCDRSMVRFIESCQDTKRFLVAGQTRNWKIEHRKAGFSPPFVAHNARLRRHFHQLCCQLRQRPAVRAHIFVEYSPALTAFRADEEVGLGFGCRLPSAP